MKLEAANRLRVNANRRDTLIQFANFLKERLKIPAFARVKIEVVPGPKLAVLTDFPKLDVSVMAALLKKLAEAQDAFNKEYQAGLRLDTKLSADNPVFGPSKDNPGYVAFYL